MAPRSPTRAFDPTPALEHNSHNYSPFNSEAMLSIESQFPNASKEVRFTNPPSNNFHRAHSIATENVPLLQQVSSASQMPKQSFRITNPSVGIDLDAYIENCRNLNEQLRNAHETERKAWNIERSALKAKIADLEFRVNKSNDFKRRSSIESSSSGTQAFRADFRAMHNSTKTGLLDRSRSLPEPAPFTSTTAPIWRGSEHGTPTARVFHDEKDNHHLPSISEDDDALPALSKEISPTSRAPNQVEIVPVRIEKVEPTLDGITLKSSGLTSSFVTKITSPQFSTPARSPSPRDKPETSEMHIDTSTLLAPLDEKLKRHAGHTPMNFDSVAASHNASNVTTQRPSPEQENPPAPVPTARPPLRPAEGSESYFSNVSDYDIDEAAETFPEITEEKPSFEPEDDKPLRGPLMLDPSARSRAAESFLSSVDAKLMEAVKEVSPTRKDSILSESAEGVMVPATALQQIHEEPRQPEPAAPQPDDDMPRLMLKKSMNFGSAYGSGVPGWTR